MKILLSSYACRATMTSEPGVGWKTVLHNLAENHEVWAIIQNDTYDPVNSNKKNLTEYLALHPMPGFHPVYLELSPLCEKLHRPGVVGSLYYHLWQQKLLSVAQELHRKVGFDLAHHVTFTRYWSPSGLRDLDIPFIWGPVGAAESAPASFLPELPLRDQLFEFTRDSIRTLARCDPALRATAKKATISLGITHESCEALRNLGAPHVEQLPLSLTDDDLAEFDNVPPPPPGPFRAMCLGRLLHWKGFHLAIRAFAIFARKNPEAELWIVGSGPFRKELEKTAAKTGMTERVRFLGYLSHADAMAQLAQAHVLLHPALHDNFPGVCLEAMAAGRPVICLNIGGPAIQVTSETGFIAPATTPAESVEAMASFLTTVAQDRALLARLSARGRARVHEKFSMSTIGASLSSFYQQAVASQ